MCFVSVMSGKIESARENVGDVNHRGQIGIDYCCCCCLKKKKQYLYIVYIKKANSLKKFVLL